MFELVANHLKRLDYSGPVGLASDDTKLLPALHPYFDQATEQHYLLGSTGEPMLLADPDELTAVIKDGEIIKAQKVLKTPLSICLNLSSNYLSNQIHLWCIQVPLPGIPTIVVAALAIPNDLDANKLLEYLKVLLRLNGLLQCKIMVITYAADGTGVERSVQQLLTLTATRFHDFIIKHPGAGRPNLNITLRIPLFSKQLQPIAMIQDAKHGSKTSVIMLILGQDFSCWETIPSCTVTSFEDGPLYHWDIEKLDRQDDNAATCLFSSDTLRWLTDRYPNCLGPMVYLFVFGELVDAYQNQQMKPIEQVQLALRACFFMEMWEDFLVKAGYPKSKHFLSHEACDITRYLIHGLTP
jgi:hypothetical protein